MRLDTSSRKKKTLNTFLFSHAYRMRYVSYAFFLFQKGDVFLHHLYFRSIYLFCLWKLIFKKRNQKSGFGHSFCSLCNARYRTCLWVVMFTKLRWTCVFNNFTSLWLDVLYLVYILCAVYYIYFYLLSWLNKHNTFAVMVNLLVGAVTVWLVSFAATGVDAACRQGRDDSGRPCSDNFDINATIKCKNWDGKCPSGYVAVYRVVRGSVFELYTSLSRFYSN